MKDKYINIIAKKNWFFLLSVIVIIPGLISLVLFGLNLSIDFNGGSRLTFLFPKTVTQDFVKNVKTVFQKDAIQVVTIQSAGQTIIVRTVPIDQKKHAVLISDLKKQAGNFKEEDFETIGPTVSSETTVNAIKAVLFACLLIVLYIAWSFRSIPKPASSWRFAICTIIALLHDLLVVIGIFSIFGHFFHVEIDSLFITALLTVLGFSVHDTIVVFDRIRENLRRMSGSPFALVVNESILQTLGRSFNTSLTVLLVLFTLLLFGGESTKWFIVALLVGITSGTYSSIFNAAPLLVVWDEKIRQKSNSRP